MSIPAVGSVSAKLFYFSPPADGAKPYIWINADPSRPQRNWDTVAHAVQSENLRGKEDSVSLDATGFQYFRNAAAHTAFDDDAAIEREYYPESRSSRARRASSPSTTVSPPPARPVLRPPFHGPESLLTRLHPPPLPFSIRDRSDPSPAPG